MPDIVKRLRGCATAVAIALLGGVMLAACGSSTRSASSATTASSAAASRHVVGTAGGSLEAMRRCLKAKGVALPTDVKDSGAVRACARLLAPRGGATRTHVTLEQAFQRIAAERYSACLRAGGVGTPAQRASESHGSLFGAGRGTKQIEAAQAKCLSEAVAGLSGQRGAAGAVAK